MFYLLFFDFKVNTANPFIPLTLYKHGDHIEILKISEYRLPSQSSDTSVLSKQHITCLIWYIILQERSTYHQLQVQALSSIPSLIQYATFRILSVMHMATSYAANLNKLNNSTKPCRRKHHDTVLDITTNTRHSALALQKSNLKLFSFLNELI